VPDAAARARLVTLRRPLEQKVAEQRAQRLLAKDQTTRKHCTGAFAAAQASSHHSLMVFSVCLSCVFAGLRGGPLFVPFGSSPSIASPDCKRCNRLLQACALKPAAHTFVPYEQIVVVYSGDMSWLSKLLGAFTSTRSRQPIDCRFMVTMCLIYMCVPAIF
jgi:hypothetical protein